MIEAELSGRKRRLMLFKALVQVSPIRRVARGVSVLAPELAS